MLSVSTTKQPVHGATVLRRGFSDNHHGAQVVDAWITRTGVAHFHRPLDDPGGYSAAYRPVQWEEWGVGDALPLGHRVRALATAVYPLIPAEGSLDPASNATGRPLPTAISMRQGLTSRTRSSSAQEPHSLFLLATSLFHLEPSQFQVFPVNAEIKLFAPLASGSTPRGRLTS